MQNSGISALRRATADAPQVAQPRRHFVTRIFLPAAIVTTALGLLAYSGRESLRPAIHVNVVPAVAAPDRNDGSPPATREIEIVQAPGWIEADPYSTWVPALVPGVVKEILFLEGEPVAAGAVVARLVDDDARLTLRRAEAQRTQAIAAQATAEAKARSAQAQALEARESFRRFDSITGLGAVAEGEMVERRQRLSQMDAEAEAAAAAVDAARAEVDLADVARDEAKLALARTEVRAATGGLVMQRVVEPGQRVMLDENNPLAGTVLRIYDPNHLQVRVDVPLADSAKVSVGDEAEIAIEMFAGRVFNGRLTRFVHEANVQKNTVQVKVAILDPAPELKPEMLVKARIKARGLARTTGAETAGDSHETGILLIPRSAVFEINGMHGNTWVIDLPTSAARKQHVRLGPIRSDAVEILDGLKPGDRVIVAAPDGLRDGAHVRPVEVTQGGQP